LKNDGDNSWKTKRFLADSHYPDRMSLMDHNRAVEIQATERYMLGQLETEERDAFEEHFFDCALCADEIRAAARFRSAGRQVAREPVPVPAATRRWEWFRFPTLAPAMASFLLLGTVVYQAGFQIPALQRQLDEGQSIAAVSLRETTRGADSTPVVPAGRGFFSVYFDLPSAAAGTAYRCTIADAAGKVVDTINAAAPNPGEPMNLLLNRKHFRSGVYTLTVRPADAAGSAPAISEFQFKL
jgi:hypothetical protein